MTVRKYFFIAVGSRSRPARVRIMVKAIFLEHIDQLISILQDLENVEFYRRKRKENVYYSIVETIVEKAIKLK